MCETINHEKANNFEDEIVQTLQEISLTFVWWNQRDVVAFEQYNWP